MEEKHKVEKEEVTKKSPSKKEKLEKGIAELVAIKEETEEPQVVIPKTPGRREEARDRMMGKVVIAACIVAVVFAVLFIVLDKEAPYSVVYLKSYSNYVKGNVSFVYVVESHEDKPSSYDIEILLSNSTVQTDSFQVDPGSSIERTVSFPIQSDTQFPAEVEVITEVNGMNYSAHFWLQGFQGG